MTAAAHQTDDRPDPHAYDTDVAIVGAGPIGLTLACALAHHGVRFRLFEKRTGAPRYSTARPPRTARAGCSSPGTPGTTPRPSAVRA